MRLWASSASTRRRSWTRAAARWASSTSRTCLTSGSEPRSMESPARNSSSGSPACDCCPGCRWDAHRRRRALAGDREQVRFCVRDGQGLVWLRRELVPRWPDHGPRLPRGRAPGRRAGGPAPGHEARLHARRSARSRSRSGSAPMRPSRWGRPARSRRGGAAILCAPADARPGCATARTSSRLRGAATVRREVAEALLRAQGAWERLLGQWSG